MPNINLLGANLPQSFDVQAELLKQAQAQQMAQALLSGSMQQQPGIVHTGGSNPFARDVVNLSPLGQLGQAFFGKKMLGQSQDAQQALAQFANQREQEERGRVMSKLAGTPESSAFGPEDLSTMMSGAPPALSGSTPSTPPSVDAAIGEGGVYSPAVKAIQDALLKAKLEAQIKGTMGGSDVGSLARGVDPTSIAPAMGKGMFGQPVLSDPSQLRMKPEVVSTPAGTQTNIVRPGPQGDAVTPVVGHPTPDIIMPGEYSKTGVKNTGQVPMTMGPDGKLSVNADDPRVKSFNTQNEEMGKALAEGQKDAQSFGQAAPKLIQLMKLSQQAALGMAGPTEMKVRQFGVALGFSNDESGKIPATQMLAAMSTLPAITLVHLLTSRGTQQELQQAKDAVGASANLDPRAVQQNFANQIADGMSLVDKHNSVDIPNAQARGIDTAGMHVNFTMGGHEGAADALKGTPAQGLEKSAGGPWMNPGATNFGPANGAPPKAEAKKTTRYVLDAKGNLTPQ